MDAWLKEHLVCPREHYTLELRDNLLVCPRGHKYPYLDGIPVMLLEEAKPTHGDCCKTLEQTAGNRVLSLRDDETETLDGGVDPYVQEVVAATCGLMYRPLIGKLSRYPIPELRLPDGAGETFLDIGCNWGRWCISAALKGYAPVGVDPSLDAVRAARRVARQLGVSVNYVVADARYLPFSARCFNITFSYSVLQHFSKEDAKLCLAEIARTLKCSGISTIQMPNIFGLRNLYHQLKRGRKEATAFDVRYWSLPELKKTFTDFVGPTSFFVDGYFALGVSPRDTDLLPLKYRFVVRFSEGLRQISEKVEWLKYFADSVFVKSSVTVT